MIPNYVYNLNLEKYPVRVVFCLLNVKHAGRTRIGKEYRTMPKVWIAGRQAIRKRLILWCDSKSLRTLAIPLPELPRTVLQKSSHA